MKAGRDYSLLGLLKRASTHQRGWPRAWRTPAPKSHYKAIIVGGGGHGLATAYYLARNHRMFDVAVIEAGWIGGGNTGRNTQVVRSNYFWKESIDLYDLSLRLYETLGRELNFNLMLSQRGQLHLFHTPHEEAIARRWVASIRAHGVDCIMLSRRDLARRVPILNLNGDSRYPILGAFVQPRSGVVRHDAVAWAFARAASGYGVDVIQNCRVGAVRLSGSHLESLETTRGTLRADKYVFCAAGGTSELAAMAGFRLPLRSFTLQAMVSEPVKPLLNTVVSSPLVHVYVSQSDRGEFVIGGAMDAYESWARRGSFSIVEDNISAVVELMPCLKRLRLMRQWGGAVDVTPDRSPILGRSPLGNVYLNCGWGSGGFKAIPVGGLVTAHQLALEVPHPVARPFGLDRFRTGRLVDESAASGVSH